jgi:ubiquinone biosynthesis accessory factor UbiJ
MSRYLTPLPGLLAMALDQAFNQAIELDREASGKLEPLVGRTIKLALIGVGIDIYFSGTPQRLIISADSEATPDTTITGSPSALLAMTVPEWRAPGSGVRIEGDAGTAQALEKLFRHLDPDWETLFSQHLGPVLGHQLWRLLQDAAKVGRHSARTAQDQLGRYLREESGLLVTRPEVEQFTREVDEVREAVDRLQSRLRRQGRA